MTHPADMARYYSERAHEYERIYALPERQADIARLRDVVEGFAASRRILEVACGTGYWTAVAARRARHIVATDIGETVLAVARAKGLPADRVTWRRVDASALEGVEGDFDAGMAAFWWSHVPRAGISGFLGGLHRRLGSGAAVLLLDNRYVEASSTPISRVSAGGDTYQVRTLTDGRQFEVLKNFPSREDVAAQVLAAGGRAVEVCELDYYWYATYEVGGVAPGGVG